MDSPVDRLVVLEDTCDREVTTGGGRSYPCRVSVSDRWFPFRFSSFSLCCYLHIYQGERERQERKKERDCVLQNKERDEGLS